MNSWRQSTVECPCCGDRASARTDQWGEVTHYECTSCGEQIEPED